MRPAFKKRLNELNELIKSTSEMRQKLILSEVKRCKHPSIFKDDHWPLNTAYVCMSCGLTARGSSPIRNGLFSFCDRPIIISNPTPVEKLFQLEESQIYALQYPRRFTLEVLETIFDGAPWTAQEVLDHDEGRYVWSPDTQYESIQEWVDSYYRNGY